MIPMQGDPTSSGFGVPSLGGDMIEQTAASAAARAFARRLERAVATLDTSKYEAVEVIQLAAAPTGIGSRIGSAPSIRFVDPGEPSARDLADRGAFDMPVYRVARYDADMIDELRTYVEQGTADDVARLVDERYDIGDRDPVDVAETLIETLEEYADAWGEA